MSELPIESPRKYGAEVYDDIDELASGLGGGQPVRSGHLRSVDSLPDTDSVDESFWRKVGDQRSKYGI